jgi:HEAT repeat protein
MNEVINPGQVGSETEGDMSFTDGFPPPPDPMMGGDPLMGQDPLLGPDPAWEGVGSSGQKNRVSIIVFSIIVLALGVAFYLFYKDATNKEKWGVELTRVLTLPNGQFEPAMRDILTKSINMDVSIQAAFELGEVRDVGAVDLLAKTVSKGGKLGREAAKALAKIAETKEGRDKAQVGTGPIFAAMQKADGLPKAEYAWALCSLGDERGFSPLLEAVSKKVVTQKTLPEYNSDIISRIGTTERLIQMAEGKDPILRMFAAQELGYRTNGDIVSPLLKLLTDATPGIAEAAAISLGRTNDPRSGPALLKAMNDKPELRDSVISALAQSVGAPGLEMIYKNSPQSEEQYKIIGKYKNLRDPRSADFLLGVLKETAPGPTPNKQMDEIHDQALWILEDLGDKRIADEMFKKTQWNPYTEEQIPNEILRYRKTDEARKIAAGAATWFGLVLPDGAADYLMKIYEANAPYSNTPESAANVRVDAGPLFNAMGRTGDQRFCKIIMPFLDQDEGFFFQAASMALGRLKCPGIGKEFIKRMQMTKQERKDQKFGILLESRDWRMEDRLQERRNSIIALRFVGGSEASEKLMEIALDVKDDQELRREAAMSLTYCSDDKTMADIIAKLSDNSIDIFSRAALIRGLWVKPSPAAVETMYKILEGTADPEFVAAAAVVIGEAGSPSDQARMVKLLDSSDEHRRFAGVFGLLLGGDVKPVLDKVITIMKGQEARLMLKQWYEEHELYLTKEIFESKRIYQRLANAKLILEKTLKSGDEISWPWKFLMERLRMGWEDGPNGLTGRQIRDYLADAVRQDADYRELAAQVLTGLSERGYLLALQSEKGPQSDTARDMLRAMNSKSK